MKKINLKNLVLLAVVIFSTFSCVNNDDFKLPPVEQLDCVNNVKTNTTISDVLEKYGKDEITQVKEDLVFSGYIISSDNGGNFHKSIVLQDAAESANAGIQVEVNLLDYIDYFPIGSKLFVNLKGLDIAKNQGMVKIGKKGLDTKGREKIAVINSDILFNHLKRDCAKPSDITPTIYTNIKDAKKNKNLNTLIRLEEVQFKDANGENTYYNKKDK